MGRIIRELCAQHDCTISFIYDTHQEEYADLPEQSVLDRTDVLVEFTVPQAVLANVKLAAEKKTNMIIGTTGWYRDIEEVKSIVEGAGIGVLYAQNFSIGVQLFLKMVKYAATLVNAFPEYDISVHERHHNKKADAPSGTAFKIAETILKQVERKEVAYTANPDKVPNPSELYMSAERIGNVPGTHTVLIDGLVDSIELTHTARSREGLAIGALNAAHWIKNKQGLFTIEDMIDELDA